MTAEEFRRLELAARASLSTLNHSVRKKLLDTYKAAATEVADKVARAEYAVIMKGHSELTVQSLVSIELQLRDAADAIAASLGAEGEAAIRKAIESVGSVHDRYWAEVFNRVGKVSIERVVAAAVVSGVNERVVESVLNRVWQDGYKFSSRVWKAGQAVKDDLRAVLSSGLAQGRDILDIAQDIQVYATKGKAALMNRYGELLRGTREFARRIPKSIDYRAVRLVRTETYSALRDASIQQGIANPAALQLWDWVRQSLTDWGCSCPDYAANSPYTLESLPSTPHANCLCAVTSRMVSSSDFADRLQAWSNGVSDPALDQWYHDYYLPNAA